MEQKTIIQFAEEDLEGVELRPVCIVNELNDKIMEWASNLPNQFTVHSNDLNIERLISSEEAQMSLKHKSKVQEYRYFHVKTHVPKKTLEDYINKADDHDKCVLLKYFTDKYEPSVQEDL